MKILKIAAPLLIGLTLLNCARSPKTSQLYVSSNQRFLVRKDGKPFFWLGDTAWQLFTKLNQEETDHYLQNRADKNFTVIQAHILGWGLDKPNANGDTSFTGDYFTTPNEPFWQHADYVIKKAESLGLYMGILPVWASSYIEHKRDPDKYLKFGLDSAVAYQYGLFLGKRYKAQNNIIWILGGDNWGTHDFIYDALAQGLTDGAANGNPDDLLITYHPQGGTYRPPATSTSEFYHDKAWLDFNMIQSGHRVGNRNYLRISKDYAKTPIKPTLESEPCYEHHPVKHRYKNGEFTAWHLRRRAYWSLLAGGFGFTYGGNGIWQMDKPGAVQKETHFKNYWYEAIDYEGAFDMPHIRALFESRPFLNPERIPDQSIMLSDTGMVDNRVQCARAKDNSYAIIYITNGHAVEIDLMKFKEARLNGYWFDPREGTAQTIEPWTETKSKIFTPPTTGEEQDWVLVIDKAEAGYGVPGK